MNIQEVTPSNKSVSKTKQMVITAVLGAFIVIMGYTPLGLIPLPGMTATILHIPVAIGAIMYGPKVGITLGAVMGLTTMSKALLSPVSPLDPLFMNPLVSLIPRAAMGLLTAYVYVVISKLIKNAPVSIGIAGIAASVLNTVFTLGALVLVYWEKLEKILEQLKIPGTVMAFIGSIVATNGIAEIIVTIILIIPIVLTLKKASN